MGNIFGSFQTIKTYLIFIANKMLNKFTVSFYNLNCFMTTCMCKSKNHCDGVGHRCSVTKLLKIWKINVLKILISFIYKLIVLKLSIVVNDKPADLD